MMQRSFNSDKQTPTAEEPEVKATPEQKYPLLATCRDASFLSMLCQELFKCLDNIDSADDVAKDNNELYRQIVRRNHRERFNRLTSDGYNVFLNTPIGEEPLYPKGIEAKNRVFDDNNGLSCFFLDRPNKKDAKEVREYIVRSRFVVHHIKFAASDFTTGFTNEIFLAMLLDRLNFVNNQMPCEENHEAIVHLNKAMDALKRRSQNMKNRSNEL